MAEIIGRKNEIEDLDRLRNSDKAEFLAVFGRRRVGKTFLIRQWAKSDFIFDVSGVLEGNAKSQYKAFNQALVDYGFKGELKNDWFDIFICLRELLKQKLENCNSKQIVFIDELPCFDIKFSDFVLALGHFWNTWAQWQDNIFLIVCGSATSWMVKNILNNRGGLHNRITCQMHLKPFNLFETELYLKCYNFVWDRQMIMQAFMILGGIPYYLKLLKNNESLAQNIDRLFFADGAVLFDEYKRLFSSLFRKPEIYLNVVSLLAKNKKGLTRTEIVNLNKTNSSGHLSKVLDDLVQSDFVRLYHIKDKKISATNGIYQLIDNFVLFYNTFSTYNSIEEDFWSKNVGKPELNTWKGLAFERTCLAHIKQIKRKLHIDTISTKCYSWRSNATEPELRGAQIDLVIERADGIVNICEMKYSDNPYTITKDDDVKMKTRISLFLSKTKTKCGTFVTYITSNGLTKNCCYYDVPCQVVADDLFDDD